MQVEKKELKRSEIELRVEMSFEEFKPYIEKGAQKVSEEIKIDGFRKGKVPYEILKQKIGEMTILEEGARIAINKTLADIIKDNIEGQPVGSPKIDILKIAPNNPLEFKVVVALIPSIEISDYKSLKLKRQKIVCDPKELEKMLNDLGEMRVVEKIVEREAKDGDKVLVDIRMYQDNVALEGGQGKNAALVLGKDYVIPGFDKQIVGAKKGDEKEFSLPYPQDFHMQNLAGKMVDFKVKINEIYEREIPALDDDFAKSLGLKKMSELRENVEKSIINQKTKEAETKIEREMFDELIKKTKFGDIPQVLIEHESDNMLRELEQNIAQQGAKFDDYLKSLGKNKDQLALDFLPEAMKRVKVSLLIREISLKENIKATDGEVDKQIEKLKEQYKNNSEILKRLNSTDYREYTANVMSSQKVIDKLKEWNIENEK